MVILCLAALLDQYPAIAALDEVVNVIKDKKDDRATRYEIALRKCRLLKNNLGIQQILFKLVHKLEDEMTKAPSPQ